MSDEVRKPGRPRTIVEEKCADQQTSKVLAKTVQLAIGVDLLGSAMSLNTKAGNELEVTPLGIKAHSKKTKRRVLIPWTNIRGIELL